MAPAAAQDYDIIVRNARVVDGSGKPAFAGAVAVSGDRIAAVGEVSGTAALEIDAGGKVLAPGFIDIHTHYDPQLCWDRLASPSPEHGVTSLVMGNCSISLAPVRKEHRQKVIHLFGSVEDMEGRLLEATVPFEWEDVPEYLAYLRRGLGPNVGVMIGHSVLRYFVMGEAAQSRAATAEEISRLAEVLGAAMDAGALGLSLTYTHFDDVGNQLPCHYAEREELLGLMKAMSSRGRGVVEVSPQPLGGLDIFEKVDLFGGLALETGVTCSLSPVLHVPSNPDQWHQMLARIQEWQAKGAPIWAQTQTRPLDMTIRLDKGSPILSKSPMWRRIMDMTKVDRIASFSDPSLRDVLYEEAETFKRLFDCMTLRETGAAENQRWLGKSLADIAEDTGKRFTDALIDIALSDDLESEFSLDNYIHADPGIVMQMLDHPVIHIGSGDAGAHITAFAGAGDTCYLFERYVRAEGRMSLERAVQRLTSDIARDWKIEGRGEISPGKFADLVLFDPAEIARGPEEWVEDVPGGSGRYVRHPQGIHKVIVNGALLVDNGSYTEARPGRLI